MGIIDMENTNLIGAELIECAPKGQMLIQGPNVRGFFFITLNDYVWDGTKWRGFGVAAEYATFHTAMKVATGLVQPSAISGARSRLTTPRGYFIEGDQ